MSGAAIGGALSAFTGLVSNVINNNRLQANFEDQMKFARWQHEDLKRYNSIPEQVQQMRAAGINPAFMYGKGGQQMSAISQPTAPSTNPLDMNGLSSMMNTITLNDAQVRNLDSTTAKNAAEATGQEIENKFKADEMMARINSLKVDYDTKKELIKSYMLNNEFATKSLEDRLWQQKMESQLTQAQAQAQFYSNQYIPLKYQAEIDNLMATAKAALMNGTASISQAHAAIMNAQSTKNAFDAQYGGNPKARAAFAKATYSYLLERTENERSQQFKNYSFEQITPFPARRAQYDRKSGKWYEQSVQKRNPIFRPGSW